MNRSWMKVFLDERVFWMNAFWTKISSWDEPVLAESGMKKAFLANMSILDEAGIG